MRQSKLLKAVSVFACLSILLLTVPAVNAAPKFDFKLLLKKPAVILSSLVPFFAPIYDTGKTINNNSSSDTGKEVRITGTMSCPRVSDGD